MTRFVYELDIGISSVANFGPEQVLDMETHDLDTCLMACDADEACQRLIIEVSTIDDSQLHCTADSGDFGDGADYILSDVGTVYHKLQEIDIPVQEISYRQIGVGARDGVPGTRPINAFAYDDYLEDLYGLTLEECQVECNKLNTCAGYGPFFFPKWKQKKEEEKQTKETRRDREKRMCTGAGVTEEGDGGGMVCCDLASSFACFACVCVCVV